MLTSAIIFLFFFNDTATTEIYTLSLHDALPISFRPQALRRAAAYIEQAWRDQGYAVTRQERSEEHTSELQSRLHLVCRLLLEKKKAAQSQDRHPRPTALGHRATVPHDGREWQPH